MPRNTLPEVNRKFEYRVVEVLVSSLAPGTPVFGWFEKSEEAAESNDAKPEEQRNTSDDTRGQWSVFTGTEKFHFLKHGGVEQQHVYSGNHHEQYLQLERWIKHEQVRGGIKKTDTGEQIDAVSQHSPRHQPMQRVKRNVSPQSQQSK